MKQLTISRVSTASIRANRKTYLSLAVGIVLAVFLATALTICAFGIIQAKEQKIIQIVGNTDCVLLDEPDITDASLRQSGLFDQIGKMSVVAAVKDSVVYLGYTDDEGQDILCRNCIEGRLPEQTGEIAVERSALEKLRLELEVGDTVTWVLQPMDGAEEEHSFTIVGILNEQSQALDVGNMFRLTDRVLVWPGALISPEETFATGRTVVHRVMTYAPLAGYSQAEKRFQASTLFGVSRTQATIFPFHDPGSYDALYYLETTSMLLVLGISLLLAVCIGISSAMESVLTSKTEEIGMLRAVGATKRQIRRIFGRDAWLLSLVSLPVGLVLGVLAAWLLCRLAPGDMIFSLKAWLIGPILLISVLCIAIASGLPLRRAARQMPMGVLRDTALLRKAGHFKSKNQFRATELIAARQLRIHPWRQLGAALLVMATLICTAFAGEIGYDTLSEITRSRPVAFSLSPNGFSFGAYNFTVKAPEVMLSAQDLAQIRNLPQVENASLEAQTCVNLLFEGELPTYFQALSGISTQGTDETTTWIYTLRGKGSGMDYLTLTDDDPEPPEAPFAEDADAWYRRDAWERFREMRAVMTELNLSGKPVRFILYVTDLDQVDFSDRIVEGRVDLAAIDAGREVLVYAPTYYLSELSSGSYIAATYTMKQVAVLEEYHNDYFYSGLNLPLVQLIQTDDSFAEDDDAVLSNYAHMERHDATVTVGAVLDGDPIRDSTVCIITTEKGAAAMGFLMTFISGIDVSLTDDVDLETEQALQNRLERIAMRGDMQVNNLLETWREQVSSMQQAVALFGSIALLFFTVAVAMQVGNAGRRIRSDVRMIGTLRAVGADEKALLGCYRLPLLASTVVGAMLAVLGYATFVIWYQGRTGEWMHPLAVVPAMCVLAALCVICCLAGLRVRLKTVLDHSIVENIKEL